MASIYALMLAAKIRSFLDDSVMAIKDLTTKANKENKKGARRRIPANYILRPLCVLFRLRGFHYSENKDTIYNWVNRGHDLVTQEGKNRLKTKNPNFLIC